MERIGDDVPDSVPLSRQGFLEEGLGGSDKVAERWVRFFISDHQAFTRLPWSAEGLIADVEQALAAVLT